MATNCYKCGAEVEDGRPFCPQCNAPQIRVVSPTTEPATDPLPPGTPEELQPPAEPLAHQAPTYTPQAIVPPPPPRPNRIRVSRLIPGALIFLVLAVLAGVTPLAIIFAVVAGGLALAIYHRADPSFELRPRNGFKVSAFAAGLAMLVILPINLLVILTAGGRELLRNAMAAYGDGPQKEALQQILDLVSTPAGMAEFLIRTLFSVSVFVFLSGLGGSIGAYLFGKREQEKH